MFYVDRNMVKSGLNVSMRTPEEFAIFLKSVLIDGAEIAKPDAINGDILIFNNGYKINPGLDVVEISNETSSFNIRLTQIDGNTLKADKNLLGFTPGNTTIRTPRVGGWDYEETATHYIFHNNGAAFELNKSLSNSSFSVICRRGISNKNGTGHPKSVTSSMPFYILYNDYGFFLYYIYSDSGPWGGVWAFYNNEYSTDCCVYGELINWNNLNNSIVSLNGMSSNSSEFLKTNQSFSSTGGPVLFFSLTSSGNASSLFLNVSGNLTDHYENASANLVSANNEKVIILKNRTYFMGLNYDYSVYQ